MNTNQLQEIPKLDDGLLKPKLQQIIHEGNLQAQRALLIAMANEMSIDVLDCAAALLHFVQQQMPINGFLFQNHVTPHVVSTLVTTDFSDRPPAIELPSVPRVDVDIYRLESKPSVRYIMPTLKMVRYRLDIGKKHQISAKELKKVLVEESGVDPNNINNVMIHSNYTLIELPDDMPQDIFQHLKTVEINHQKLNIKRLKPRNKKQAHKRYRRGKQWSPQQSSMDS